MSPNHPSAFLPMVFAPPSSHEEEPPARVVAAITFLSHLTAKTSSKCAVNDISIEWQDGQKLQGHEVEAQMAACDLLTNYFRGKLRFDQFEMRERAEISPEGTIVNCPGCLSGPSQSSCVFCRGIGRAIITPLPKMSD